KTCNNDKNLSEIQLEHEKEDEFVMVVVKTLGGRGGESFWEGGDDFGVDVLRFSTCLTDILSFLEKLKWWFEKDIDDEGEENEDMRVDDLNKGKDSITWQSMVWMEEDVKYGLVKQGNDSLRM
ncbi:hypothetical protein Tco_1073664, partial [Tanacetum coccineum]